MPKEIFVNIPVEDLERSKAFYSALGFKVQPRFTNEKSACFFITENMFVMVITDEFFKTFSKKKIADPDTIESITALSVATKEEVDTFAEKAFAAGATTANDPYDYGYMYGKCFYDPDGHMWEVFYMDMDKAPAQM